EDFGTQGEPPSHPELLDWLATEFLRTGWNVKAMQRLIVTSATYRQSSRVTPELLEKDPENRLLARGPRFRLPAETVRDNARALAQRALTEAGPDPADRVKFAFRLATDRDPKPGELGVLVETAQQEVADYRRHADDSAKLVRVGESKSNPKLDKSELAAWTT